MAKSRLSYMFHNPNSAEDTRELLWPLLIEANRPKAEKAIQQAVDTPEEATGHPD